MLLNRLYLNSRALLSNIVQPYSVLLFSKSIFEVKIFYAYSVMCFCDDLLIPYLNGT